MLRPRLLLVYRCCILVGLTAFGQLAQAQIDTTVQQLRDVQVIGAMGRTAANATMNIKIYDSKQIQQSGANNLGVFVQQFLNLRIEKDNILGAGLSVMGISGENVKILRDGVPMIGRQNGNIDLTQIPLNNIERIEVIEGSLSVLYGTNALAGAINLVSKSRTSKDGFETQLYTYQESNGHHDVGASIGYRKDTSSIFLTASRNLFRGWSPPSDSVSRVFLWKPRQQYFVDLVAKKTVKKFKIQLSSAYFDELIVNRGEPIAPYGVRAFDDQYKTFRFNNSLTVNKIFGKDKNYRFDFIAAYNDYKRIKNRFFKNLNDLSENLTENAGDQDTSRFGLTNIRATVARFGTPRLNFETGTDLNIETGVGERLIGKQHQIGDYAAFASAEWIATPQLTLRPALRLAYNTAYTARPTPSLNLRLAIDSQTMIRLAWGQGFRAPALKELYLYFVDVNHNIQGNADLKAELSNTVLFSVKKSSKIWGLEVGSFFNDIHNLITLAQKTPVEYTYININRYQTYGVTIGGQYQLGQFTVAPSAGLTQRVSYFDTTPFSAQTLEGRAQLTYSFTNQLTTLNIFYKYNGKQPGFAASEDGTVTNTFFDAYQMADFTANIQLWKGRIWLTSGVKNIFNVTSVAANFGSGIAHAGDSNNAAVANGRTIFLSINLKM